MEGRTAAVKPAQGPHGIEYLAWESWDKPAYQRGPLWYAVMTCGGLLLLLQAVFSANFLFALIILMFAVVLYLSTKTPPTRVVAAITDDGVVYGKAVYPYRDIQSFWMVYDPPSVKTLYLEFRSIMQPSVTIELEDSNPNAVREHLGRFVREDITKVDEPVSDAIGRILKI